MDRLARLVVSLIVLLVAAPVWAEEVVRYDEATGAYQGCRSLGDTTLWLTNPNDYATVKPGFLYASNGCGAVLPGVPDKYRKVDAGVVVEMSQTEKDALEAAQATATLASQRAGADAIVDTDAPDGKVLRAFALVVLDEINLLRQRTNAVKSCVANAANLTAAKDCEATLSTLADRTIAQLKTAIQGKISDGSAD